MRVTIYLKCLIFIVKCCLVLIWGREDICSLLGYKKAIFFCKKVWMFYVNSTATNIAKAIFKKNQLCWKRVNACKFFSKDYGYLLHSIMIRKAARHGLIGNATYKKDAIAIKAPFAAHEHAQSLKLFLQLLLLPDELFDSLSRFQLKLQY